MFLDSKRFAFCYQSIFLFLKEIFVDLNFCTMKFPRFMKALNAFFRRSPALRSLVARVLVYLLTTPLSTPFFIFFYLFFIKVNNPLKINIFRTNIILAAAIIRYSLYHNLQRNSIFNPAVISPWSTYHIWLKGLPFIGNVYNAYKCI